MRPLHLVGWFLILLIGGAGCAPEPVSPDAVSVARIAGHPAQVRYTLYAQAAQTGKWDFAAHRQAGSIAHTNGDLQTAAAHWHAALLLDPSQLTLARELAETYLTLQAWTPAIDTLRILLTQSPEDAWAQYQLGVLLAPVDAVAAQAHLKAATSIEAFAEATSALLTFLEAPVSEHHAFQVGVVLADQGLWGQAERAFHIANLLHPDDAVTWGYIGLSRTMQGKIGDEWLVAAAQRAPELPMIRYLQGVSWRAQRQYAESLAAFQAALAHEPLNPVYYAELGETYYQQYDLLVAAYWLRLAVVVSENALTFRDALTRFYDAEAEELTALGVEPIVPDTPTPDDQISVAVQWYELGEIDAAQTLLEAVLTTAPEHPSALFYLAQFALHSGQLAQAQALLTQLIALETDLTPEAQALLETVLASNNAAASNDAPVAPAANEDE